MLCQKNISKSLNISHLTLVFRSGKGYADDYYLDAKSQCAGKRGACPDNKIKRGTNNVRLLNSAVINQARTVVATCSTYYMQQCSNVQHYMLQCSNVQHYMHTSLQ